MNDFDFFDSIYYSDSTLTNQQLLQLNCNHKNIINNNYNKICIDCGIELNEELFSSHIDSQRCNIRKDSDRNIYQEV